MTVNEGFAIGVDLGGSNLRIGAYTQSGKPLGSPLAFATDPCQGHGRVIDRMCEAIHILHDRIGSHAEFAGVGIGSPGPLSLPDGVLHQPPNLPGWDGVELLSEVTRRLPWPVWVDSDANLAALAECRLGAGSAYGIDSLCMITLGTGVGGGVVVQGRVWHGLNGAAGELGHGPLVLDGLRCNCGARGCLELYASATGVVRRANELGLAPELTATAGRTQGDLTASRVAELAAQGNQVARQVYEEAGYALGLGLANLVNVLNLPLYTIGGGVSAAWDLFAPRMFKTLEEFSYVYRMSRPTRSDVFERTKTHVCRARLGSSAGLLGAALLPFQVADHGNSRKK